MDAESLNALKRCSSAPIINDILSIHNNRSMASTGQTSNSTSPRDTAQPQNLNIFGTRSRRYSTSFSPLAGGGPRLTPRVSQLRQEECADISNSREVTHEREVHTHLQISQSWEDLTLDGDSMSVKSDTDVTNPLHVTTIPSLSGILTCSSPSPTSRTTIRAPYGTSPSPTRRTFSTTLRRSMSPIAMRPSSLGPVKRKFEMDDTGYSTNYSPPPFKRMFTDSSGNSPICQSPSALTCPSPDLIEGRTTPKLYLSKLFTNSCGSTVSSSLSSSPSTTSAPSPSMEMQMDLGNLNTIATEPMATSDEDDETVAVAKQLSTELRKLEADAKSAGDTIDAIPVDKMTDSSSVASTNTNASRKDALSFTSDNESSPDAAISWGENLTSTIVVTENLVVPVAAPPLVEAVILASTTTNGRVE